MATITEELLQEVLSELKTVLRPADHDEALKELTSGEPGIAFETICTQLFEYDLHIPQAVFAKLRQIGRSMNLPPKKWEILTPLID